MLAVPPSSETSLVGEDPVTSLKSKLSQKAKILTPKDGKAFEDARKIYNGDINSIPRYIVQVAGVSDVIQCVKFGAQEKIRVAIRCGGHSVRGDCIPTDSLVICGSLLRNCRVDPEAKTATAQQGCLLLDIDHETNAFGLCVPGLGTASITGSFGLTLGGGQGWLNRKYGLAVDNVISADMVLADGSFVKCSQSQNADLFWAIRGGGGRFGVVTHLTYRCIETPMMNVSVVIWIFEEQSAKKIISEYFDWSRNLPFEAAALVYLQTAPLPHKPKPIVMLSLVHQGTVEEGKKLLEPLLLKVAISPIKNTTNPMEYVKVQSMMDSVTTPGAPYYEKNGYILKESLTPEFANDIVTGYIKRPKSMVGLYNICCGGVVANENPHTSYPVEHRRAEQVVIIFERLENDREKCIQWAKELDRKLPTSGVYVNACAPDDKVEDCFLENLKKLREIKKKYDPTNLFGKL